MCGTNGAEHGFTDFKGNAFPIIPTDPSSTGSLHKFSLNVLFLQHTVLPWVPSDPSGPTDRARIPAYRHRYVTSIIFAQVSLSQQGKIPPSMVAISLPTADQVPFTCEMSFFCATCMTALAIAISSSSGWTSSSGFDLIVESLISLQLRTANVSESSSLASRSNGRTLSTKHAGTCREEISGI